METKRAYQITRFALIVLVLVTVLFGTTAALSSEVSRTRESSSQKAETILQNESVLMVFDKENGSLKSFIDKKTGTGLLSGWSRAEQRIFAFEFTQKGQQPVWTDNRWAQQYIGSLHRRAWGTEFVGAWLYKWERGRAKVILNVSLPHDSTLSKWNITISIGGNATLEQLSFPILSGIDKIGTEAGDDRLLVPQQSGAIIVNPYQQLERWAHRYPSGYCNMQFMSFYDDTTGFFLSSLDEKVLSKSLYWVKKDTKYATIGIDFEGLSSANSGKHFSTNISLGIFHGDWTTAATIYRNQVRTMPWSQLRIREKKTPDWFAKIGIGHTYVMNKPTKSLTNWVEKIQEQRRFFSVPTLAVLEGWEHGGLYEWGDYFPPRDGWENFSEAVGQVVNLGAYPWVLIGAQVIKEGSHAWKSNLGNSASVIQANGNPLIENGEVRMCFESREWLNQLEEWSSELARRNIRLLQLDGFPIGPLQTCYSKNHNHGAFPGNSFRPFEVVNNLRDLRMKLKSVYPELSLSGESGAEVYLPVFDGYCHFDCYIEVYDPMFNKNIAKIVPLFQYVYHPYIIFVDGYHITLWDYSESAKYNNLALGRCFIWGEVCQYNMQDWLSQRGNQVVFPFLIECAKARVGFLKDFLVFGQMLPPPIIEAPLTYVESEAKKYQGKVPSALASAWQSEKGDVAIIVLNIGEQILKTSLSLSPYEKYIHPGCRMEIYLDNDLIKTTTIDHNYPEQKIELESLQFTAFIFRS